MTIKEGRPAAVSETATGGGMAKTAEQNGTESSAPGAPASATFAITIFPDVKAKSAKRKALTFDQLCDSLAGAKVYESKVACPLVKLATFGDRRTEKGSLRFDANVLEVTGVEGDHDAETMAPQQAADLLRAAGVQAVIYTSPSHMLTGPRWRVLAPTSAPQDWAQRRSLVARLNGVLGGALARESFTLSQSFYFGRVRGVPYECIRIDGAPIDLLPALDSGAIDSVAEAKEPGSSAPPTGEARANRFRQLREGDPVFAALRAKGLVLVDRADGAADIQCPFRREHTSKSVASATTYFPANTGGFASPAIVCQHAHCRERPFAEYASELGVELAAPTSTATPDDFDNLLEADAPRKKSRQFRLIAPGELLIPKPIEWLIKGYIERGVLALLFGDWGTGKSFIAIALALAVARGGEWNGRPVKGAGAVLYLAGEGHQGIGRRYRAQALHLGVDLSGLPFYVTDTAVQFIRPKERVELLQLLDTLEIRPALIVVDTLHRHFNGGVENDEADMGKFVEACDALRLATGATVLAVHHVGHNEKGRPRGSSALPADFDVMFGIEFNKTVKAGKVSCVKMKDAEESPAVRFALRSVELGRDEDGDAVTSAVPVFGDAVTEPVVFEPVEILDLAKGVRAIALVELADLLDSDGLAAPDDAAMLGVREVVDAEDWREKVLAAQRTDVQKTAQKKWQRARADLADAGLALSTEDDAFAWITPAGRGRLDEARECALRLRSAPKGAAK